MGAREEVMSSDEQTVMACQRYDELELKAADGTPWTTEECKFARRHADECEICAALAIGLDAIRYDGAEGSIGIADEVTARRVVNGALEASTQDSPDGAGEAPPVASGAGPETIRRPRGALRRAGLSAAVAAVTALVVAVFMMYAGGDAERLHLAESLPSLEVASSDNSVLPVLMAGVVRSGNGAVSLGEPLRPSAELHVVAGRAAIRIGGDVMVLLSSNTTVRLAAANASDRSLWLVAGDITVSVKPRPRRPRFTVRVADARVTVTGTIFSVRNDARGAEVAVLRGAVRVTAPRRAVQVVTRTRRYVVGTRSTELLEPPAERLLRQRARALDLLRTERPARLSLRTDPAGATVLVDGTVLGVTPLDGSLGEGQRDLELRLPNHTPVRERVLLRSGVTHERDFQLERLRPRPAASPSDRDGEGHGVDDGWRALVRAARAKRAARDWRGAAKAYRELIRRYPHRGAARAARVSLGFLQLEHLGQAGAALASFRRYLADSRRGALAREASWGRILALAALGRRGAEKKALTRFLARYPRSVYRPRAARRLRSLGVPTPKSKGRTTR
jgi:FecR-like protein/PEGA domain-containing protein/tetratricopeptide repeat protein